MPSKKKKYNARFPAGRIKKIMQTDEEVGKVAQAVPVIISRTLELFVESLLKKAMEITSIKNAKTLSPSHMKQCILSESRFDFLKDLVKSLPDVATCDYDDGAVQPNAISDGKSDSASSGTGQRQEGTSIPSNRDDKGCMPSSAEPTAVSSNKMNLNFYKESEEANISGTENFRQHAAARHSLSYGQDAEDSGSENEGEYQVPAVVPQYKQPKASAVVDEDYDT